MTETREESGMRVDQVLAQVNRCWHRGVVNTSLRQVLAQVNSAQKVVLAHVVLTVGER